MQDLAMTPQTGIMGTGAWVVLVLLLLAMFGFVLFFSLSPG
ncbi:MAG TPA: hypothetical protein VGL77_16260 [Armatimonadota bacterium]|jgi:hypothetical protein